MRLISAAISGAFALGLCACSRSGGDVAADVTRALPTPYLLEILGQLDMLDSDEFAIVQAADRIESFRIESRADPNVEGSINGYPLIAKGPDLTSEQTGELKQMVVRLESYIPLGRKACGPLRPGVALRFYRGEEHVTALVCFTCNEWTFAIGDSAPAFSISNRYGGMNFEGCQRRLLSLCQQLFPDDKELAGIKPVDSYGAAYHLVNGPPVVGEEPHGEARCDLSYESEHIDVLAKYLPGVEKKVESWDRGGGFGDSIFRLDGVLYVYTTPEKHAIIVESGQVVLFK